MLPIDMSRFSMNTMKLISMEHIHVTVQLKNITLNRPISKAPHPTVMSPRPTPEPTPITTTPVPTGMF